MAFFMSAAYSAPMRRARQGKDAGLPSSWLFTDERLGGMNPADPLWRAIDHLPRGAGIVFRHYSWPLEQRRQLLAAIARIARRRHLRLVGSRIGGAPDGIHRTRSGQRAQGPGLKTASAHGRRELVKAFRDGADIVFLSPVFPTQSHPGEPVLGPVRFGLTARGAGGPVMALGGMTARRAHRLRQLGAAGFGAIDFWRAQDSSRGERRQ